MWPSQLCPKAAEAQKPQTLMLSQAISLSGVMHVVLAASSVKPSAHVHSSSCHLGHRVSVSGVCRAGPHTQHAKVLDSSLRPTVMSNSTEQANSSVAWLWVSCWASW